jgi:signal-transduction protein with cAMP-binding, CBS, and nucleotidyltransferase domain
VGILTDSDLIKKIIAKNKKPSSVKVKSIMSSPLVTSKPDETILEATRKMKRNNIKRLPVIENGKLVGILSLSDIAKSSPEMIDLLEYKLKMREYPTEIKEKFTSGICESCGNYTDDLRNVNDKWLCETCREELEE